MLCNKKKKWNIHQGKIQQQKCDMEFVQQKEQLWIQLIHCSIFRFVHPLFDVNNKVFGIKGYGLCFDRVTLFLKQKK